MHISYCTASGSESWSLIKNTAKNKTPSRSETTPDHGRRNARAYYTTFHPSLKHRLYYFFSVCGNLKRNSNVLEVFKLCISHTQKKKQVALDGCKWECFRVWNGNTLQSVRAICSYDWWRSLLHRNEIGALSALFFPELSELLLPIYTTVLLDSWFWLAEMRINNPNSSVLEKRF